MFPSADTFRASLPRLCSLWGNFVVFGQKAIRTVHFPLKKPPPLQLLINFFLASGLGDDVGHILYYWVLIVSQSDVPLVVEAILVASVDLSSPDLIMMTFIV